ncbi:MAG: 4-(cytidine 5'-diphospho)-2-C-methyl-D-erythritol kinase [Paracoccaceae bacterium]
MTAEAFAPAKINLALHVTGRRGDGYHLIDSLVVFADLGDRISVTSADRLTLEIVGPEAAPLVAEPDNLVLRAARAFGGKRGAAIRLEKHLPVASGIGGGSADAAAALRALSSLWDRPLPAPDAVLSLGADVPVCLVGAPARMRGIGGHLTPLPPLPEGLALLLVNPRIPVSTAEVFRILETPGNAPLPDILPDFNDMAGFAAWLAAQRNDLEPPAIAHAPVVGDVLSALRSVGPLMARMSGSGATCFGLFDRLTGAQDAAKAITTAKPDWWVKACALRTAA